MPTSAYEPTEMGKWGKNSLFKRSDRRSQHRADKERGSEHAAGRSAGKREGRSEDFEQREREKKLPGELAAHRLIDDLEAGAHHLGCAEVGDRAYDDAGDRRLDKAGPAG